MKHPYRTAARIVGIWILALLALAFLFPNDAHATPTSDTITVNWYLPEKWNDPDVVPTAGDPTIWDQPFAGFDGDTLQCGRWVQVDIYWLDRWNASEDAVLADGKLTKSNGTPEDSHMLAWGAVDGDPWSFRWTGDCVEPTPDPSPSPSVTPTPTPTVTAEPSPDPEPTPTPTPTPEPPACDTGQALACSGPNDYTPFIVTGAAACVGLGITLIAFAIARRNRK